MPCDVIWLLIMKICYFYFFLFFLLVQRISDVEINIFRKLFFFYKEKVFVKELTNFWLSFSLQLISHYTIFSGGLWCMLNESCPRPQEMVRRYAEQSSAQMSLVQHRHNSLHGHLHHHHHQSTPYPYPVNGCHIEGRVFNENCRTCLKTATINGHHRRRRVSTPTNLKLKEWFNTINHKWARIKRQVILHHQRQQPLINEDNYGTNGLFTASMIDII